MRQELSEFSMTGDEEITMSNESSIGERFCSVPFAYSHDISMTRQTARLKIRPTMRRNKSVESEAGLVERLKAGDEAALEKVFNVYSAKLYNVALRIVGDSSDAEEVIQDVFLTAFRKVNMFQGHSQFSTWLYRLTVNAALGRIRRSKKYQQVAYDEFLPKFQKDGHHQVRPVIDWSDSLDQKYADKEIRELLSQALDQLKPLDKSVVVLSDLEGLPDKEIAETLHLTVSAVKTRLHRARLFLRGKLTVHLGHSPA